MLSEAGPVARHAGPGEPAYSISIAFMLSPAWGLAMV